MSTSRIQSIDGVTVSNGYDGTQIGPLVGYIGSFQEVRADLETFMERLVSEKETWYTHDLEGPDDATSHIRSMLTDTGAAIPVDDGKLSLGTWQGIYIFEHRARPHRRTLLMRVLSVA